MTLSLLLQFQYGSEANDLQIAFGALLLIVLFAASVIVLVYLSSRRLSADERRQARAVNSDLLNNERWSVRITAGEDIEQYREQIRASFNREFDQAYQTVLAAIAKTVRVFAGRITGARDTVRSSVSTLALRLSLEGFVLLLLAVPASIYLKVLAGDVGSGGVSLSDLVSAASESVAVGVSLIKSIPGLGFMWKMTLAYALSVFQLLDGHVFVVVVALLVAAVVVAVGDRQYRHQLPTIHRTGVKKLYPVGKLVVLLLVGVVGFFVGVASTGSSISGAVAGLVGSFVVGAVMYVWMYTRHYDGAIGVYSAADSAAVYGVTRAAAKILALMAVPIIGAWIVRAVQTRKYLAVMEALVGTHPAVQIVAGVVGLLVCVVLLLQTRPAWGALRESVLEAFTRRQIRTAMWLRGVPFLFMIVVMVLTASSRFAGWPVAIVLGVGTGIAVRLFAGFKRKIRYKYALVEREDRAPSRLVLWTTTVTDADDREIYVAWLNGSWMVAHRDRDVLVEQIITDLDVMFREYRPEPSFEHYYAGRVRDGQVDLDTVTDELWSDVWTEIEQQIQQPALLSDTPDEQVSMDTLRDEVTAEYPSRLFKEVLREQRKRGVVAVEDGVVRRSRSKSRPFSP